MTRVTRQAIFFVTALAAFLSVAAAPELAFADGWGPFGPPPRGPLPPGFGVPTPPPGGVIVVPGGGPSGGPGGFHPPIPVPPGPGHGGPGGVHPPIPVPPGPGHGGGPWVPPGHGGTPPGNPPVIVVPGGGPLHTPPAMNGEPVEQDVADLVASAIAGYGCDSLGQAAHNLANELLGSVSYAQEGNPWRPLPYQTGRPMSRQEFLQRWISHLTNPQLMQKVWNRLADLYRSCNQGCFDDGTAVGQISAAGYCAASVGVGGINDPSFLAQAPLPLCQNATNVGCIQSYQVTAAQYQGCSQYTIGSFDAIFRDSISQDCHIDQ